MTAPVERSPEGKAIRSCAGCGQRDDHPRHTGLGQLPWHMDCHVLATDCPICAEQIKDADGATGAELQGHLIAKPPLTDDHIAELLGQSAPNLEG